MCGFCSIKFLAGLTADTYVSYNSSTVVGPELEEIRDLVVWCVLLTAYICAMVYFSLLGSNNVLRTLSEDMISVRGRH